MRKLAARIEWGMFAATAPQCLAQRGVTGVYQVRMAEQPTWGGTYFIGTNVVLFVFRFKTEDKAAAASVGATAVYHRRAGAFLITGPAYSSPFSNVERYKVHREVKEIADCLGSGSDGSSVAAPAAPAQSG